MQGMRAYFPNNQLTEDCAAEYFFEWAELVKNYGIERFEEAAVLARRYRLLDGGETVARQFFPLPAEIEDFIRHKTQPLMRSQTDVNCKDCKGTGWKYVAREPGMAVVRCHCRKLVRREVNG